MRRGFAKRSKGLSGLESHCTKATAFGMKGLETALGIKVGKSSGGDKPESSQLDLSVDNDEENQLDLTSLDGQLRVEDFYITKYATVPVIGDLLFVPPTHFQREAREKENSIRDINKLKGSSTTVKEQGGSKWWSSLTNSKLSWFGGQEDDDGLVDKRSALDRANDFDLSIYNLNLVLDSPDLFDETEDALIRALPAKCLLNRMGMMRNYYYLLSFFGATPHSTDILDRKYATVAVRLSHSLDQFVGSSGIPIPYNSSPGSSPPLLGSTSALTVLPAEMYLKDKDQENAVGVMLYLLANYFTYGVDLIKTNSAYTANDGSTSGLNLSSGSEAIQRTESDVPQTVEGQVTAADLIGFINPHSNSLEAEAASHWCVSQTALVTAMVVIADMANFIGSTATTSHDPGSGQSGSHITDRFLSLIQGSRHVSPILLQKMVNKLTPVYQLSGGSKSVSGVSPKVTALSYSGDSSSWSVPPSPVDRLVEGFRTLQKLSQQRTKILEGARQEYEQSKRVREQGVKSAQGDQGSKKQEGDNALPNTVNQAVEAIEKLKTDFRRRHRTIILTDWYRRLVQLQKMRGKKDHIDTTDWTGIPADLNERNPSKDAGFIEDIESEKDEFNRFIQGEARPFQLMHSPNEGKEALTELRKAAAHIRKTEKPGNQEQMKKAQGLIKIYANVSKREKKLKEAKHSNTSEEDLEKMKKELQEAQKRLETKQEGFASSDDRLCGFGYISEKAYLPDTKAARENIRKKIRDCVERTDRLDQRFDDSNVMRLAQVYIWMQNMKKDYRRIQFIQREFAHALIIFRLNDVKSMCSKRQGKARCDMDDSKKLLALVKQKIEKLQTAYEGDLSLIEEDKTLDEKMSQVVNGKSSEGAESRNVEKEMIQKMIKYCEQEKKLVDKIKQAMTGSAANDPVMEEITKKIKEVRDLVNVLVSEYAPTNYSQPEFRTANGGLNPKFRIFRAEVISEFKGYRILEVPVAFLVARQLNIERIQARYTEDDWPKKWETLKQDFPGFKYFEDQANAKVLTKEYMQNHRDSAYETNTMSDILWSSSSERGSDGINRADSKGLYLLPSSRENGDHFDFPLSDEDLHKEEVRTRSEFMKKMQELVEKDIEQIVKLHGENAAMLKKQKADDSISELKETRKNVVDNLRNLNQLLSKSGITPTPKSVSLVAMYETVSERAGSGIGSRGNPIAGSLSVEDVLFAMASEPSKDAADRSVFARGTNTSNGADGKEDVTSNSSVKPKKGQNGGEDGKDISIQDSVPNDESKMNEDVLGLSNPVRNQFLVELLHAFSVKLTLFKGHCARVSINTDEAIQDGLAPTGVEPPVQTAGSSQQTDSPGGNQPSPTEGTKQPENAEEASPNDGQNEAQHAEAQGSEQKKPVRALNIGVPDSVVDDNGLRVKVMMRSLADQLQSSSLPAAFSETALLGVASNIMSHDAEAMDEMKIAADLARREKPRPKKKSPAKSNAAGSFTEGATATGWRGTFTKNWDRQPLASTEEPLISSINSFIADSDGSTFTAPSSGSVFSSDPESSRAMVSFTEVSKTPSLSKTPTFQRGKSTFSSFMHKMSALLVPSSLKMSFVQRNDIGELVVNSSSAQSVVDDPIPEISFVAVAAGEKKYDGQVINDNETNQVNNDEEKVENPFASMVMSPEEALSSSGQAYVEEFTRLRESLKLIRSIYETGFVLDDLSRELFIWNKYVSPSVPDEKNANNKVNVGDHDPTDWENARQANASNREKIWDLLPYFGTAASLLVNFIQYNFPERDDDQIGYEINKRHSIDQNSWSNHTPGGYVGAEIRDKYIYEEITKSLDVTTNVLIFVIDNLAVVEEYGFKTFKYWFENFLKPTFKRYKKKFMDYVWKPVIVHLIWNKVITHFLWNTCLRPVWNSQIMVWITSSALGRFVASLFNFIGGTVGGIFDSIKQWVIYSSATWRMDLRRRAQQNAREFADRDSGEAGMASKMESKLQIREGTSQVGEEHVLAIPTIMHVDVDKDTMQEPNNMNKGFSNSSKEIIQESSSQKELNRNLKSGGESALSFLETEAKYEEEAMNEYYYPIEYPITSKTIAISNDEIVSDLKSKDFNENELNSSIRTIQIILYSVIALTLIILFLLFLVPILVVRKLRRKNIRKRRTTKDTENMILENYKVRKQDVKSRKCGNEDEVDGQKSRVDREGSQEQGLV